MSDIPYILLRASLELFQKPPYELDADQLQQAETQAKREFEIESRTLGSDEATGVVINPEDIDRAFNEIRQRYPDEETFLEDLKRNNLDSDSLHSSLERQCKVTTVLEKVASRAPEVNDVEVGIFYHSHLDRFHQPERREAFHILVSINDQFEENTREEAHARISRVAVKLAKKPQRFGQLAMRYSECPTALNEGKLGTLPKGKLYKELDAVLFELEAGKPSEIIESPMGFHILLCKKIHHPETMSFKEAAPKIRKMMEDRYQRNCQRAWLASLAPSK